MMRSTDNNPYSLDEMTREDNIRGAIELAEYVKETFADKGHEDEAMNVSSLQWGDAIVILKSMLSDVENK